MASRGQASSSLCRTGTAGTISNFGCALRDWKQRQQALSDQVRQGDELVRILEGQLPL